MVEGLGREVLPHPYHIPATPTPRRIGPSALALNCGSLGARSFPSRPQRFETGANAHSLAEHLAGDGGSLIVQRIQDAKFQPVHLQPVSEIVVKLLLRDRRLRHAEAAESAGWHQMRVHRASQRTIVRNVVWSRGVYRHARRNRRPPRGIGAGIEIGGEIHRGQLAFSSRARAQVNAGGMALGGRDNRFLREYTMRTGRRRFQAASATKGCTDKSSFAPKPPPTAVGIIRTASGAIPRIFAMSARSMYGDWVQA